MPQVLVLSDDLVDAGKVMGPARSAGLSSLKCKDMGDVERYIDEDTRCVAVDLHVTGVDIAALTAVLARWDPRPFLVGFGSHVDAERLSAARKAGCDLVLPRSKFFEDVASKVAEWAGESR